MITQANEGYAKSTSTADPSPHGSFVDLEKYFDEWLKSLAQARALVSHHTSLDCDGIPTANIYIESTPGSHCEVRFEGVLQVNGRLAGNIRSLKGTFMTPERGVIEANIDVGVALINGCVNGNITASERVVLQSQARVDGNIDTPSLSIDDGAVFEGQCNFGNQVKQTQGETDGW